MTKKTSKKKSKSIKQFYKRANHKLNTEIDNNSSVAYYSYEITYDLIEDSTVPYEVRDEMANLFEKSQKAPHVIIERLKELINKYPNVPKLYNFISIAYSQLEDREKSKIYAVKNYENNPDYLFAKLNYAEICMHEGNYEKIPEIFDNKFEIKALYPERNVFHITEVVSFMGIVGLYFAHVGKEEQAKLFCENLEQLAPNHPFTEKLKQHLFINTVKNEFNQLIARK